LFRALDKQNLVHVRDRDIGTCYTDWMAMPVIHGTQDILWSMTEVSVKQTS